MGQQQVVLDPAEENAPDKAKVGKQQAADAEADRLRSLGITVVRYQINTDGKHVQIRDFLREQCLTPAPLKRLTFLPKAQA